MDNLIQMFNVPDDEALQEDEFMDVEQEEKSIAPSLTEARTSHYTIYVDLPQNDEEMVLVHGYLGHRVVVSKSVANYLRSLETKRAPRPLYGEWSEPKYRDVTVKKPSADVIAMLEKRSFLTKRTFNQELSFFKQYVELKARKASRRMPSYLFMPTYNCNLRCPYCFQDHMRKDPSFASQLKLMDKPTVDLIFSAMPSIEKNHGYANNEAKHRHISFFGGEPLLESNREIVQYIMNKANEIGSTSFSATSNATELHHYEGLLGDNGISEIQVTLDGTPEEHDKRRIYPNGAGSFEVIAKNITLALNKGVRVSVRLNIDYNNINDLPELASVIIAQGWTKFKSFGTYLAPISASNDNTDKKSCITTRKLDIAMKKMKEKFPITSLFDTDGEKMLKKAESIFKKPQKESAGLKTQYCAAHSRMYLFDALADIYACWEKTGDKNIRIGSINKYTGLSLNKKEENRWRSRTVASNQVCAQCRYAMHCGGGCAIIAEDKTGSLHSNDCDSFGKRFRASVATAYIDVNKNVELVK